MKKRIVTGLVLLVFAFSPSASRADMFGGDVAVLTQILANALMQLARLKSILDTGQDSLNLMRDIYKGINDSLNLIHTLDPNPDPGLYREWQQVDTALREVGIVYGLSVPSENARVQNDADRSVAEAITLNNSMYDYSRQSYELGEQIKSYSHSTSPAGAQKLTAQALGVMLQMLSQNLRAQSTGLKLQAQTLAIQNRKDKELTKRRLEESETVVNEMKTQKSSFAIPRF
jgi:hypothetical protein